jgi:sec-independent protein translocase protein TatA
MESIGLPELLVIGLVFIVLFGGKKLPEIGKGIGDGIKNFKAALKGEPEKAETEASEKV